MAARVSHTQTRGDWKKAMAVAAESWEGSEDVGDEACRSSKKLHMVLKHEKITLCGIITDK